MLPRLLGWRQRKEEFLYQVREKLSSVQRLSDCTEKELLREIEDRLNSVWSHSQTEAVRRPEGPRGG